MVEIQALTTPTVFGLPRRTANGVDMGRLLLITAVLSKRVGLALGNQDIIVNVGGGFRISEPAADLGIALALASSFRNAEVNPDMVALGEVGLSGDVRPVPYLERRLSETIRLGFQSCLAPRVKSGTPVPPGIELIQADTLREAIKKGLMAPKRGQASGDPPPGAEPRD
jgi:DNA repair protein RadA/Sms